MLRPLDDGGVVPPAVVAHQATPVTRQIFSPAIALCDFLSIMNIEMCDLRSSQHIEMCVFPVG